LLSRKFFENVFIISKIFQTAISLHLGDEDVPAGHGCPEGHPHMKNA
jgi:hypothetical protein